MAASRSASVFKISKLGTIAGCMVIDGHIQRGSKIRLIRDGRVITEDLTIDTLKRVKDDVKEVKQASNAESNSMVTTTLRKAILSKPTCAETIARTL